MWLRHQNTPRFFFLFFVLFFFAIPAASQTPGSVTPNKPAVKNPKITYRIIEAPDGTFGYDIVVDGKPFIHQTHMPAVSGNKGFSTREKARKVAEFVVRKIKRHEIPPTVTLEDLKKMNVLDEKIRPRRVYEKMHYFSHNFSVCAA